MPIALHVVFRAAGVKWPLRDDDRVEVWSARSNELLFVITGELLKALLRHHLDALAVQSLMAREMERLEPPKRGQEPMPAENPVDKDKRQTLRDQRRVRKPPRKMLLPLGIGAAATWENWTRYTYDINDLFWTMWGIVEGLT
jgi:hypothetical protein